VANHGHALQIYSAPSLAAPTVGYVADGTQHAIIEYNDDHSWVHIATPELQRSNSGWVEAAYLIYIAVDSPMSKKPTGP
jgi:hypothetical protein